MKIEKLSSDKIKVTVTASDFDKLDLTPKSISPQSPELRQLVISIIRKAELETDFNAVGANILIEAIPSGGDFIFLISKKAEKLKAKVRRVGSAKRSKTLQAADTDVQDGPENSISENYYPPSAIYSLESFDAFLAFMSAAGGADALREAYLYYAEGAYYLKIPFCCENFFHITMLACEFANREFEEKTDEYLNEYGKIIAHEDDFYRIAESFDLACQNA